MLTTRILERTYGISRPGPMLPPRETELRQDPLPTLPVKGGQGRDCPLPFVWLGLLLGCVIVSLRAMVRLVLTGRTK